jgi:hypothetical protein
MRTASSRVDKRIPVLSSYAMACNMYIKAIEGAHQSDRTRRLESLHTSRSALHHSWSRSAKPYKEERWRSPKPISPHFCVKTLGISARPRCTLTIIANARADDHLSANTKNAGGATRSHNKQSKTTSRARLTSRTRYEAPRHEARGHDLSRLLGGLRA